VTCPFTTFEQIEQLVGVNLAQKVSTSNAEGYKRSVIASNRSRVSNYTIYTLVNRCQLQDYGIQVAGQQSRYRVPSDRGSASRTSRGAAAIGYRQLSQIDIQDVGAEQAAAPVISTVYIARGIGRPWSKQQGRAVITTSFISRLSDGVARHRD
jgi:hypothetical protein